MKRPSVLVPVASAAAFASLAGAQSLNQRPVDQPLPAPPPPGQPTPPNPAENLQGFSLIAVQPLQPRRIVLHDLVTIIVNQSSKIEHDQSLDTEKKTRQQAEVGEFPNFSDLFTEFQLKANKTDDLPKLDITSNQKFEGEGEYSREDRITTRITAEVVDVKPNGTVLLEARTTLISDDEEQTMVLSGTCRIEDITGQNTVQSTQLADLHLETRNTGAVRDGSKKGLITKVLDALFNF